MSDFTLGLDIGSNSIGWALLDVEGKRIVDAGVRVFPEGVDRDTKGKEVSKNETRRTARGMRRARKRRNYRKDKLLRMLIRNGLLPAGEAELKEVFEQDPYLLRAKGLDERLRPYEFGRVLYHLNQRRGFWSNRKSGTRQEDGVVVKSATLLQEAVTEARSRTLGEYFSSLDPHEKRIRGHYTFRSMYEDEFEQLWATQSTFDGELLSDDLKQAIQKETIFFQRPLKPSDDLIGDCELEAGEKRCPRADWHARRFRILQTVNDLRIINPDGTQIHLKDPEHKDKREIILKEVLCRKETTFDSLRKKLGLLETQTFNFEEGAFEKKSAKLKGDEFITQLKSSAVLGKAFNTLAEADLMEINAALLDGDLSDEELIEKFMEQYSLTEAQARGIVGISLPSKYASFSRVALQKLLPHMEEGLSTSEAIEAVYGERAPVKDRPLLDRLPLPEDLRNPIVNKALFEVRKVVNALIREYGKPSRIRIEMARDIKGSQRERDEIRLKQWKNEQEREKARQELQQMNVRTPSRDDILKYLLWQECRQICPYTGRPISQAALFGPNPEFQIEHIIPYSRCLDDSFMNKTLCHVQENIGKGNETPYEYYARQRPEQYEQILQRVAVLPFPKRRKFAQKEVELDTFIQRQLNDTRYISRKVVEYLKTVVSNVQGTKGQATAELRHLWGLNSILDYTGAGLKNRDDHRHHAVDALVTALTGPAHLRDLAASKYDRSGRTFPLPWEGFREQAQETVNRIQVSHRVMRKVSGPLHEETSYGPTGLTDDKGQALYVYRKPLEALTLPMVGKIVDPIVREIVKGRLLEFGLNPEGKGSIPKEVWKEPLYMRSTKGVRVPIKKVRIREVFNNLIPIADASGRPYRYVASGSNHHIELFEFEDVAGRTKREGRVISMFEAVRRSRSGQAVVCRDYGDGKRFVCSLSRNELFLLETEDGTVLHRVQKIDQNGRIILRPHTFAGKLSDGDKPPLIQRKGSNTIRGRKVTVDPIGRVFPAKD